MAANEATNQESRRLELKSDTSQDSSEEKVQWKRDFLKQAVANAGEQGGNEKPRKERTRKAAQSEQRRRIEIRERIDFLRDMCNKGQAALYHKNMIEVLDDTISHLLQQSNTIQNLLTILDQQRNQSLLTQLNSNQVAAGLPSNSKLNSLASSSQAIPSVALYSLLQSGGGQKRFKLC